MLLARCIGGQAIASPAVLQRLQGLPEQRDLVLMAGSVVDQAPQRLA